MTHRRLPPFSAMRAFEAAARHMSFKAAAEELCVTPSSISHRVKTLEAHLGQPVFHRKANRLALTKVGEAYRARLSELLDQMVVATEEASAEGRSEPFRILSTPCFAGRWLMPRMGECPLRESLSVRVSGGAPETDFGTNNADLIVHWGDSAIPGSEVLPLMRTGRFPVAHPDVAKQIRAPQDLLSQPLLRDEVDDSWAEWFRTAGVAAPDALMGGTFNANCELNLSAAERGQGVALAYDAVIRSTLEEGRLVRLFDIETAPVTIYSVAYPEACAQDPRIRAMRDWLLAETEAEGSAARPADIIAAQ